jgi:SNF2 family DNA or RNA helicase
LGVLLQPYIISGRRSQPFRRLEQNIIPETIESTLIPLSDEEKMAVKWCGEYSERALHKVFAKRKSVKDFFDQIDEKMFTELIRPYIEKKMSLCINNLQQTQLKIYFKEKDYQVVYEENRVFIHPTSAKPLFHFIKAEPQSKYYLTVKVDGHELELTNKSHHILSTTPCNILIDNTIYHVDNIDAKKLQPFFNKSFVLIPKLQEKVYFSGFVLNAIKQYEVEAEGFTIQHSSTTPKAELSYDVNLNAAPAFVLKFKYNEKNFTYGSAIEPSVVFEEIADNYRFTIITRNTKWEQQQVQILKELNLFPDRHNFFQINSNNEQTDSEKLLYDTINWINNNTEALTLKNITLNTLKLNEKYFTGKVLLDFSVKEDNDWFDILARIKFGNFEIPFWKLRKYIIEGIREFTLPDDSIAILPEEWFAQFKDIFLFSEHINNTVKLKRHHFALLDNHLAPQVKESVDTLRNKLLSFDNQNIEIPSNIQAELRNYQKTGFAWMRTLYENGFGGCLADDMGLGKTLQTITLLTYLKQFGTKELNATAPAQTQLFAPDNSPTSLIVMPISLIHNWERETRRFSPSLRIHKYTGTSRTKNVLDFQYIDIVLTSYGVLRNDIELLKKFPFHHVILDESQAIKNPDSKIYKAVLELKSEYKLVITGTPIENSLTDLWAQMNFVNRGILGSLSNFKTEYLHPIEKVHDQHKQEKLKSLISPFILRRTKELVAPELPEITEQLVLCEMTPEQKSLYESEKSKIRNMILDNIGNNGIERSSIVILKGLNKLRLMANHPIMTDSEYPDQSGKFEEIASHIENVVAEGHKVLIFSSYVKHLTLFKEYLESNKHDFAMLTGATQNRGAVIESFTSNESKQVFLISLKAGGTGLNLTAADYVFIIDPWWNPAAENQAISRAHRIGQDKKVFVYRFITRETIEEKILQLQERKSAIAELFINSNNPFRNMTSSDINDLFD